MAGRRQPGIVPLRLRCDASSVTGDPGPREIVSTRPADAVARPGVAEVTSASGPATIPSAGVTSGSRTQAVTATPLWRRTSNIDRTPVIRRGAPLTTTVSGAAPPAGWHSPAGTTLRGLRLSRWAGSAGRCLRTRRSRLLWRRTEGFPTRRAPSSWRTGNHSHCRPHCDHGDRGGGHGDAAGASHCAGWQLLPRW